jgi:hypothetical protein
MVLWSTLDEHKLRGRHQKGRGDDAAKEKKKRPQEKYAMISIFVELVSESN